MPCHRHGCGNGVRPPHLRPAYVGLIILPSSVYGITVLQTYIYFWNSSRDSIRLKAFVSNKLTRA